MSYAKTIGNKRQRITFQVNTPLADGAGGWIENWATYYSTWADVRYLSASRKLEENQVALDAVAEITVRWRSDKTITKSLRIIYRGRTLMIHSIINIDERKREIVLMAVEKQ